MKISRRRFLEYASSIAVAGLGASCRQEQAEAPRVRTPWGVPPSGLGGTMLPLARRPEGTLELFLLGGLSPWETFYTVPDYGNPAHGKPPSQWWTFQQAGRPTVPEWVERCTPHGTPLLTSPWTTDSLGAQVHLGPFIEPLRQRPDILARMRVWVMSHDVEPHEAGIPLGITGHGLGNPRMASLGSHLQRYWQETGDPSRSAPYSYTIYMSTLDVSNNGTAASAVGLHRASARPMAVRLGRDLRLPEQLPRPGSQGFRSDLDAAVRLYTQQLRQRLADPHLGPVRAPALDDFQHARSALERHEILSALLGEEQLRAEEITLCMGNPIAEDQDAPLLDETTAGIRLARHLLTAPEHAARYVQVMEGGIFTDPAGQGYDSHAFHVGQQANNCYHMAKALAAAINEPGENDPSKLDLDRHFVLLNTEFGRTPTPEYTPRNPDGQGSNHWPWGYIVIGFGAFADQERSGIVGALGEDAIAVNGLSPAEHRAAMLLAHGVWPFSDEGFATGDLHVGLDEAGSALWLREHVLGHTG